MVLSPPSPAVPALASSATTWLWTIALFVSPGLVAGVLWSPFLVSERFRALFVALPPGGRLVPSYVGVALGLSVPYLIGVLLTVTTPAATGPELSEGLLDTALFGGVLVGLIAPAVAGAGLPRVGVDWDPTDYGVSTWVLLVGAGLWYAVVAAVPLFALAIGMALPGGY